jgi:hypothetical protein
MMIANENLHLFFSFQATYGTLQHDNIDDGDRNYVVISEDNVVLGSCDPVNGRYVSRVVFDFVFTPSAGASIWLYTFQRNGTTNQFSVVSRYQITAPQLAVGAGSDGVQVINLNSTALPVTPGLYVGAGFNSLSGGCYRSPVAGQYYLFTVDSGFAGLSTNTYLFSAAGCATFTFDVVEF